MINFDQNRTLYFLIFTIQFWIGGRKCASKTLSIEVKVCVAFFYKLYIYIYIYILYTISYNFLSLPTRKLSPHFYLRLQTLKSDIKASWNAIACQIKHFYFFFFSLEYLRSYQNNNNNNHLKKRGYFKGVF
jgi:hypothetical protein